MKPEREHTRALLIYRIRFSVLRKRLTQMQTYVDEVLKKMSDEELFQEYLKQK